MVIIPAVVDLQLPGEVLKGIEGMSGIEPLIVLTVTALHFSVMSGCKGTDLLVKDPMPCQVPLKQSEVGG